jgi:hypothetical protein
VNADHPAGPGPFRIDPSTVYRPPHLAEALGVPLSGILRDIRAGRLRTSKRRGRLLILGSWVLAWLEAGEVRRKASKSNGHVTDR